MAPTHAEMVRQMKRVLEMIDSRSTSLAGDVMQLPSSLYHDPDYWRRELRELFHKRPIVLALGCELPGPGTFVAIEDVPGFRVLVTRDEAGRARAFFNSCRHRGAPVAAGRGEARRFACPYHGWTYATDGSLMSIPGEEVFGRKPCAELSLIELPVEERHGLVFGALDPHAELKLDEWLGDYGAELEAIGLAKMHPMWSHAFQGPNWKVCKDGFIENYHFSRVHSKSLPNLMGIVNVTDFWGLHSRMLLPDKVIHQQRKLPEAQWDPPAAFATVYYLFPNTMIASCWGDWPLVTRLFPGLRPDQSTCVQTLLTRLEPTPERQAEADGFEATYKSITQNEDYVLDYAIQRSMENHPGKFFTLGRNEHALQHFHASIAQVMGTAAAG